MTYKKGMIVRNKDFPNDFQQILAQVDNCFLLSLIREFDYACRWMTASQLDKDYTVVSSPKEEFRPKKGDVYFLICDEMRITSSTYANDRIDTTRLSVGNCFRTREEAEAKAEEIKKILKK